MSHVFHDAVRLEPITTHHLDALFLPITAHSNFAYVEDSPPDITELRLRFEAATSRRSPNNPQMVWLYWVARSLTDYVGTVEIGIFPDGYAEIGFVTFEPFRNCGYATAFCTLAISEALVAYPNIRLHASVNELNLASRRVVERLGFALLRINKQAEVIDGRSTDELVYSRE